MVLRWILLVLAMLAPFCAAMACGERNPAGMVVSTAWLAAHLESPGVVVLAVGERADYDRAHIPGARAISRQDVSDPHSKLTLELPPVAELVRTFEALGVSNDSHVVLYAGAGRVREATRVYFTLDSLGLGGRTSLLDGGLEAWQKEGRPVTTEAPAVRRGTITPCPQSDVVVDADYVKANLHRAGVDIVDARLPEFYRGESAGMGKRAGHIPGAVNLPFDTLVDAEGKLLPAAALRERFASAGVPAQGTVVSYCHIGLQASVVYFVARYLGRDARLYDGSWEDWSARGDVPVVEK